VDRKIQPLKFYLLGDFKAFAGEKEVGFPTRHSLALPVFLLISGRKFSREYLSTLFWGDFPETQSRHNLRQTLYLISRSLASKEIILSCGGFIQFNFRYPLYVDVRDFETLIKEGDIKSLEKAVDLYRGDFMEGFYMKDSPEFDNWMNFERERLREYYIQALEKICSGYYESGDHRKALDIAYRALRCEPLCEKMHLLIIQILFEMGERERAMKHFQAFKKMIQEELGIYPSGEILTLIREKIDT